MGELQLSSHYSRTDVREEIARFSRGRWVGIHCSLRMRDDRPILIRYERERPLTINGPDDVWRTFNRFGRLGPRVFYATANTYSKLSERSDVASLENVVSCMPTWDIDNSVDKWKATIEAAREIYNFLEKNGIRSVIMKWSGRGMHVHVHQEAISQALRKRAHPLDIAYSIVEHVNRKLSTRFEDIRSKTDCKELRVDNEMDLQRLFTAPLSLHKELDIVAVVLDPNEIDSFDLSYASPASFKHFREWDRFSPGEADELAKEALERVGGYPLSSFPIRRTRRRIEEEINKWRDVEI